MPAARCGSKPRPAGQLLCVAGERAHLSRRLHDFLKREARRDLTEASRRYAAALDVSIGRITLRDTASRWGSCSSSGALSYSWRLIFAPPFVLDYLAAHEIAHRREMNHGPRFWKAVDMLYPDRERAERWLKVHGPELHRYGVETDRLAAHPGRRRSRRAGIAKSAQHLPRSRIGPRPSRMTTMSQ